MAMTSTEERDEFGAPGAEGDAIRAWLAKRASYADPAHRAGPPAAASGRRVDPAGAAPGDVDATAVGRAVVEAAHGSTDTTLAPSPEAEPAITDDGRDATAAGRSVVDALRTPAPEALKPKASKPPKTPKTPRARKQQKTAKQEPEQAATQTMPPATDTAHAPTPTAAPSARTPRTGPPAPARVQHGRWSEPEQQRSDADASTDVRFTPVNTARTALSVALLLTLAFAVLTAVVASREQNPTTIGVAAVAAVLTLVVWAARAGAAPTLLSIEKGQLVVSRNGHTEVIDIASPYTPVAVVSEPGLRGWAVLVERADRPLLEITAAMVDPYWFTTALYRLRPDLRPGPRRD